MGETLRFEGVSSSPGKRSFFFFFLGRGASSFPPFVFQLLVCFAQVLYVFMYILGTALLATTLLAFPVQYAGTGLRYIGIQVWARVPCVTRECAVCGASSLISLKNKTLINT